MVSVESIAIIIANAISLLLNPAYWRDVGNHYIQEEIPSDHDIASDLPAIFKKLKKQLPGLLFDKINDIEYRVSYQDKTIQCYYVFDDMKDYNEIKYNYVINLINIKIISDV